MNKTKAGVADSLSKEGSPKIEKDYSYYTYKITAPNSGSIKYYLGVRHIKVDFEKVTLEDCLQDNYYGSGGVKYKAWRSKHKEYFQKEILEIFNNKEAAYAAEHLLVDDLWKTDENCVNSTPGGIVTRTYDDVEKVFTKRECISHGLTTFQGTYCCKCLASSTISMKICKDHGLSKHKGDVCFTCANNDSMQVLECETHGKTKHRGRTCLKCAKLSKDIEKECPKHGLVKFSGGVTCYNCRNESFVSLKACVIHGESKHIGEVCYKCRSSTQNYTDYCEKHGDSKFQGRSCVKCISEKKIIQRVCIIHGSTTHFNRSCAKCSAQKDIKIIFCTVHGNSKHLNKKCVLCKLLDKNFIKVCEEHLKDIFDNDGCQSCKDDETKHNKWHKNAKAKTCRLCQDQSAH